MQRIPKNMMKPVKILNNLKQTFEKNPKIILTKIVIHISKKREPWDVYNHSKKPVKNLSQEFEKNHINQYHI